MAATVYYRGGPSLKPRTIDLVFDRATGLLRPNRGVSVYDRPDGLDRFGGAFAVGVLPPTLRIVQRGRDPHHFEIAPVQPMTADEYEAELNRVVLVSS